MDTDRLLKRIQAIELIGDTGTAQFESSFSSSKWDNSLPPASCWRDNLVQMKNSKSISSISPGIVSPEVLVRPPLSLVPSSIDIPPISELNHNDSLLLKAAIVSSQSQSSEDDGSFDYDSSPFSLPQLCPRGWAISGLNSKSIHHNKQMVVMNQPSSSVGAKLPCHDINVCCKNRAISINEELVLPSIIANPLEELLTEKVSSSKNSALLDGGDMEKRVTFALSSDSSVSVDDTGSSLFGVNGQVMVKTSQFKETNSQNKKVFKKSNGPSIIRQTASFHGRENYSKKRGNLSGKVNTTEYFNQEPKVHEKPIKMKSEADLLKATSLIRDNLANIIENYLTKSSKVNWKSSLLNSDGNSRDNHSRSLFNKTENSCMDSISLSSIPESKLENLNKCIFKSVSNKENDGASPHQYTSGHVAHRASVHMSPQKVIHIHHHDCKCKVNFSTIKQEHICGVANLKEQDTPVCLNDDSFVQSVIEMENFNATLIKESVISPEMTIKKVDVQDSAESDVADYSFSEDSLNEKSNSGMLKVFCFDASQCLPNSNVSDVNINSTSENNFNKSGNLEFNPISECLDTKNSFSEDSLELTMNKKVILGIKEDNPSLLTDVTSNGDSKIFKGLTNSIEEICVRNIDHQNVEEEQKLTFDSTSQEDTSFSDDSLTSEFPLALVKMSLEIEEPGNSHVLVDLNHPAWSSVSTPDEFSFSIKSDIMDPLPSSSLPLHWHEEYVNLFSNVNQAMSFEAGELNRNAEDHGISTLEPINELDAVSKGSSSPLDISEDIETKANKNYFYAEDNSEINGTTCEDLQRPRSMCNTDLIKNSSNCENEFKVLNFSCLNDDMKQNELLDSFQSSPICKNEFSTSHLVLNASLDDAGTFSDSLETKNYDDKSMLKMNRSSVSNILCQDICSNNLSPNLHDITVAFLGDSLPRNEVEALQADIISSEVLSLDIGHKVSPCSDSRKNDILCPGPNSLLLSQNFFKEVHSYDVDCLLDSKDSQIVPLPDVCAKNPDLYDCHSYFNREISQEANIAITTADIVSVKECYYNNDFLSSMPLTDISPYFQQEDANVLSSVTTTMLSPVDSAPESGFASLKDSSHSDGTSDSGSVVPISKSKDSLEMTDSERLAGTDTLSDDFEIYSTVTGDHVHVGRPNSPGCIFSLAEGSFKDINACQLSECIFNSKRELSLLGIENVGSSLQEIPYSLPPSSASPVKIKHYKYSRNASLDPDIFTSKKVSDVIPVIQDNVFTLTEKIDTENAVKPAGKNELHKSASEESENQILKTSDSVSSSDTILSKVSFEEQNRLMSKDIFSDEQQVNDGSCLLQKDYQTTCKAVEDISACGFNIDCNESENLNLRDNLIPFEESTAFSIKNEIENDHDGDVSTQNMKCISLISDYLPSIKDIEQNCSSLLSKEIFPKYGFKPKNLKEEDNLILSKQELTKCKVYSSLQDDQNNLIKEQNQAHLQTSKSCETSGKSDDINEIEAMNSHRNLVKELKRKRLLKSSRIVLRGNDTSIDTIDHLKTNDVESSSAPFTHFHSEGDLGTSNSFEPVDVRYKTKSITSFHNSNSTSSGDFMYDRVSLKSQDSLDKFTHFEAISAHPKPRSGPRKKVLSVDVDSIVKEKIDSIQRSITLPVPSLISSKGEKKKHKEEKSKKRKKDKESDGSDKKLSLNSIKGFLKLNKSKDKEKEVTNKKSSTSPSLFRKLEKKAKGLSLSPQSGDKKKTVSSSDADKGRDESRTKNCIVSDQKTSNIVNDKTHQMGNRSSVIRDGVTKMGVKSTLHRSNALATSTCFSHIDKENGTLQSSSTSHKSFPLVRSSGINDSPLLYKKVLMRNLSSSQESLDVPIVSTKSSNSTLNESPKHAIGECLSMSPGREYMSPVPVMGTKVLRSAPKSFSVTIGFKPKVDNLEQGCNVLENQTASVGADLHEIADLTTPTRSGASSATSSLTKRSSSMEILVCGKIREHNPGRRRRSSGCSREGSFKLHREISVETLFEIPEVVSNSPLNENENYYEYLSRIQASRDSRHGSAWSLCENGESINDSLPSEPLSPQLAKAIPFQSHNPLGKKFSLPHNIYFSESGNEISNSNPNLNGSNSPLLRGMPLSSSFTSSPFRRPLSVTSNFSPIKRKFSSQGKNATTPTSNSRPSSPLAEVVEEFEPVRMNMDNQNLRPPNVLVYTANNLQYYESVKETLENSFNRNRYIIYHLTNDMAFKSPWAGNTTLLVICGDVATHVSTSFIRYLLDGGRVLSICSDFLNVAVPLFGTVEVQDAAVVSMSYKKWKNVQLLHHQHCFHSSPKHKRFSKDLEKKISNSGSAVSVEPTYVEITDEYGIHHRLDLTVLAKDDTWGAPSLLVASVKDGIGIALFSQVHLEKNPSQCISVDLKGEQLKRCNEARLEILRDLLHSHLELDTTIEHKKEINYTPGYLLGSHEMKKNFFGDLKPSICNGEISRFKMTLQFQKSKLPGRHFYDHHIPEKKASYDHLPIMLTGYPSNFSTVKYFEALNTKYIGRLVIYCDTLSSTMNVISGKVSLTDGMVVIAVQQTAGKGRQGNQWLSPLGCAMFSMQLHIPLASNMGQCLPFLQHIIALAAIMAVKGTEGYEHIPLALKWPNDIYLGSETKIGGIIVEASTQGGKIVANIGCGVNLFNSNPTTCINDAIISYNEECGTKLQELDREDFYAQCFNNLERLLCNFQDDGADSVMQEYYKHWLHGNAPVTVQNELGQSEKATIIGIDHFGFLVARLHSGEIINLHPDGNSFNMMEGLIFTKIPRC